MCVFLGYSFQHKGYRYLHIPCGKIYISSHVIFYETIFPFNLPSINDRPQAHGHIWCPSHPIFESAPPFHSQPNVPPHSIGVFCSCHRSSSCSSLWAIPFFVLSTQDAPFGPCRHPFAFNRHHARVSSRDPTVAPHPMQTHSINNIQKPKQFKDGTIPYPPPKNLFTNTAYTEVEPTSFTEASKIVHWREAMNNEFNALMHNGTWSLVPRTSNMNLVGCKWVFRIKRKPNGIVDRYKAHLVAKGFHQQPSINYTEKFSPVVKPTTIHTMLSIAMSSNW